MSRGIDKRCATRQDSYAAKRREQSWSTWCLIMCPTPSIMRGTTIRPMSCLFVFLCFAGCAGRTFDCEWPQEPAASLDPSKPGQLRHISDDALLAEDIAIRYADKRVGKSSGNFKGADEYRRTREQCMTQLFEVIAKKHAITQEQVRQSLLFRRTSLDIAVIVSFAVLRLWPVSLLGESGKRVHRAKAGLPERRWCSSHRPWSAFLES